MDIRKTWEILGCNLCNNSCGKSVEGKIPLFSKDISMFKKQNIYNNIKKYITIENNTTFFYYSKEGKCIFVNDNGCILPDPVKPLYCFIIPLGINNKGIFLFEDICKGKQEFIKAFKEDNKNIVKYIKKVSEIFEEYEEIRRYFIKISKHWNILPELGNYKDWL